MKWYYYYHIEQEELGCYDSKLKNDKISPKNLIDGSKFLINEIFSKLRLSELVIQLV